MNRDWLDQPPRHEITKIDMSFSCLRVFVADMSRTDPVMAGRYVCSGVNPFRRSRRR
jgi:hypothetical protein